MVATRLLPVSYLLLLISIGMNSGISDDMPKAIHLGQVKINLILAQVELSLTQLIEYLCEVCFVFFN